MSLAAVFCLSAALLQGSAAAPVFEFPAGALSPRTIAMGGAGVADAGDAEHTLNPGVPGDSKAALVHYAGLEGYNGMSLAIELPIGSMVRIGVLARHFDYGKVIEDDLGPGLDGLDAREDAVGGQASLQLVQNRVGVGVRVLRESADYLDVGIGATEVTLGITLRPGRHWTVGGTMFGLGAPARQETGEERYPLNRGVRMGVGFVAPIRRVSLRANADVEYQSRRELTLLHGGFELGLTDRGFLRAGLEQYEADASGISAVRWTLGGGVTINRIGLSVAVRPAGQSGDFERYIGVELH